MVHLFLLYLPCTFCLGFLFVYLWRRDKSLSHKLMTILVALMAVMLFANAQYFSSYEDFLSLVLSMLIRHFTTPLLPLVALMYLMTLAKEKIKLWQAIFFIALPVFVGATCATIYFMIGIDNLTAYLRDLQEAGYIPDKYKSDPYIMAYENVCYIAYYTIVWLESAYLLFRAFRYLHLSEFSYKKLKNFTQSKGKLTPLEIQSCFIILIFFLFIIRTLFSRWFFLDNPLLSDFYCAILAIVCIQFCLMGMYTNLPLLSLQFILSPVSGEDTKKIDELPSEYQQTRREELLQQFKILMETSKPYLKYSLKLDDLAAMLQTNRLYLSQLINSEYKQTFHDYINAQRIQHAKEYMREHPSATQESIANHSGFSNAQTFSRRFKLETNQTPAEWLSENL